MSWIKSDSNLADSPKFFDLVSRLKVGPQDAFWNLHHLWYWCSDHYPDGVLKNVSDVAIAYSAKWLGEPKAFVDALVSSRFLDRKESALQIHDWDQWRSEVVRSRERRTTDKRPGNDQDSTSSAQYIDSVVVLSFPVSGRTGKDWLLTEKTLQELTPLYPGVDVLLECKKALQWIKSNPTRRKTDKGMLRFISGWLERSQNRSGGTKPPINDQRREELDATVDAIIGGRRPAVRS